MYDFIAAYFFSHNEGGIQTGEDGIQQVDPSLQHSEDDVQQVDYSLQHSEDGVQQSNNSLQHSEDDARQVDYSLQHSEDGVQQVDYSLQHSEDGVQQGDFCLRQVSSIEKKNLDKYLIIKQLKTNRYAKIKNQLTVSSPVYRKINLKNFQCRSVFHPYLKKELCREIEKRLFLNPHLKNLEDLRSLPSMNDSLWQKLSPYLTLD